MSNTLEKLEALFAKVRALPPHRKEQVVEALCDLTQESYQLSEDELAILLPELERADRAEFADRATVNEILRKPWAKTPRA